MDREHLIKTIEAAGYDPEPYSGRGMDGRQCVSFTDDSRLMKVLAELVGACDDVGEAEQLVRKMSTDSMGLGTVFYWKSVAWDAA